MRIPQEAEGKRTEGDHLRRKTPYWCVHILLSCLWDTIVILSLPPLPALLYLHTALSDCSNVTKPSEAGSIAGQLNAGCAKRAVRGLLTVALRPEQHIYCI